ncbi:hypothetical protein DV26_30035 [Amycolatopsis mediterranei]|uniref:Uncharacterized protein n=1 Tax=Amycolatopsis mediterranei (strain S699) TaxID=713604 RepID=A0A9R0NVF5_AMYMS|nr:hypothetical protein RAM_14505 [Amycolatopsis mediterranei S699]KDO06993.1 hypothetical protein DV26_30035 [Amycolatopsis mediterranei]
MMSQLASGVILFVARFLFLKVSFRCSGLMSSDFVTLTFNGVVCASAVPVANAITTAITLRMDTACRMNLRIIDSPK